MPDPYRAKRTLVGVPKPLEAPQGPAKTVLEWVGEDPLRAEVALRQEVAGQNRRTLIAELERRAAR